MVKTEDVQRRFSLFSTPLGDCGIVWRGDVVVATQLPERSKADTAARCAASARAVEADPPRAIRRAIRQISALLEGHNADLSDIACDFSRIEPLPAKVYALTREIPAGETRTYGDIASLLGDKQLARSVGSALGRNPLPIIVPCHRVVGAGGKLTGFSAYGGLATKRKMLRIEGALAGETADLFDNLSTE